MRHLSILSLFTFLFTQNNWEQGDPPKATLSYTDSSTIGNFIEDVYPVFGAVDFTIDSRTESAGGELAFLESRTDLAGIARFSDAGTFW